MTNLIRFTPGTELRRMQREFDRLFESFFPTLSDSNGNGETAVWSPRVDLAETEDAYLIRLDVPGMKKEDFDVSYQQGVLSISGERKVEEHEEKANFVRLERSFGRFYRSFTLPKEVKDTKIRATYDAGVLTIHVPKAEASRPRRIEIS